MTPVTVPVMRYRPVNRPDDVAELDDLFAVIARADGHSPIGEHKYLDLLHGHPTRETGLVGEESGELRAYVAFAERASGSWVMELAIHPLDRTAADIRRTIEVGVGRIAEEGGSQIRVWAFQPNLAAALEELGFRPERELRQLTRPLDSAPELRSMEGIDFRPFRPGLDEMAWIEANNEAFAGHPENGAWTVDLLVDRMSQDWFDPAGFIVAWTGDQLAGFCWTKVHGDGRGEIYVIGVRPGIQGRGLGVTLVERGLHHLASVGCSQAILYVDSDNEPALGLYAKMGFRLDHVDRSFVRTI